MLFRSIIFQKSRLSQPGVSYPVCVKGRRASPPEQLSGMRGVRSVNNVLMTNEHERREGYREFLKATQDRRHPQYKAWIGWYGSKFNPEAFDLEEVNAALKQVK